MHRSRKADQGFTDQGIHFQTVDSSCRSSARIQETRSRCTDHRKTDQKIYFQTVVRSCKSIPNTAHTIDSSCTVDQVQRSRKTDQRIHFLTRKTDQGIHFQTGIHFQNQSKSISIQGLHCQTLHTLHKDYVLVSLGDIT